MSSKPTPTSDVDLINLIYHKSNLSWSGSQKAYKELFQFTNTTNEKYSDNYAMTIGSAINGSLTIYLVTNLSLKDSISAYESIIDMAQSQNWNAADCLEEVIAIYRQHQEISMQAAVTSWLELARLRNDAPVHIEKEIKKSKNHTPAKPKIVPTTKAHKSFWDKIAEWFGYGLDNTISPTEQIPVSLSMLQRYYLENKDFLPTEVYSVLDEIITKITEVINYTGNNFQIDSAYLLNKIAGSYTIDALRAYLSAPASYHEQNGGNNRLVNTLSLLQAQLDSLIESVYSNSNDALKIQETFLKEKFGNKDISIKSSEEPIHSDLSTNPLIKLPNMEKA